MKGDFHIHTNYSDGVFSPEKIVDLALEAGLKAISLTDHDNILSYNVAKNYLATKDVIENAVHPFTHKPLKVENKNDYTILTNAPAQSTRIRKEKSFSVKDSEWFIVKDDVFKEGNWGQFKK